MAAPQLLGIMWHVVFAEREGGFSLLRNDVACELLGQALRRSPVLEPNGIPIKRPELDEHYTKANSQV